MRRGPCLSHWECFLIYFLFSTLSTLNFVHDTVDLLSHLQIMIVDCYIFIYLFLP